MSSCVAVSSRARAETYDGPIEWRPNSEELPHRPRSGEVLREKEWGFSYPHSHGGTKSPPSYPPNSGPTGAQRKQPRRRGGKNVPLRGGQVFSEVPHRRASGMIPRETGRGLSIGGTHRVAAVERLVGATLVVALPRTAPPSATHCLGATEPGGWSGDSAGERCDPAGHPQGVPLRSSGIGSFKEGGLSCPPGGVGVGKPPLLVAPSRPGGRRPSWTRSSLPRRSGGLPCPCRCL